jgi:hypothetical protein
VSNPPQIPCLKTTNRPLAKAARSEVLQIAWLYDGYTFAGTTEYYRNV